MNNENLYNEDYYITDAHWIADLEKAEQEIILKQKTCSHIEYKEYRDFRYICSACGLEV